MILPTKHLRVDRALITVGADILHILAEPKTVSRLWDEFKKNVHDKKLNESKEESDRQAPSITYDWFILALDTLFMFNAIELKRGKIRIIKNDLPYL